MNRFNKKTLNFGIKIGIYIPDFESLRNKVFQIGNRVFKQISESLAEAGKQASRFRRWALGIVAGKVVAINIEDTDLRFLVARGDRVIRWGSMPLEPGTVKDGVILNAKVLGDTVEKLLATKQMGTKKVITSLSGFQSLHRIIEVPRMTQALLRDAVVREVKEIMPAYLEQMYLRWLKVSEKDDVQRVVILGTPRNQLDTEIHSLRYCRLKPRSMNLKPIALARLANCSQAVIIDMEQENCEMIVVAGGIPAIMRSIPMHMEVALPERAQVILQEFQKTAMFYESGYPDLPLGRDTPLFLTGTLAGDKDLADAIAAGVGFQARPMETPKGCPPGFPLPQYAVNLGLVLGASSAGDGARGDGFLITNVNMLPEAYRPHLPSPKKVALVFGLLLGIALTFPLYRLADSAALEASRNRSESVALALRVEARQALAREAREIEAAIANNIAGRQDLSDVLSSFRGIAVQRQRTYALMSRAIRYSPEGVLPDGAKLITISQVTGRLNLVGTAPSYEIALQYAKALTQIPGFSNVQVGSMSQADALEGTVGFNISLEWQ